MIGQVTIADVVTILAIPLVLQSGPVAHTARGLARRCRCRRRLPHHALGLSTGVDHSPAQALEEAPLGARSAPLPACPLHAVLHRAAERHQHAHRGLRRRSALAALGAPKRLFTQVRGVADGFFVPHHFVVLAAPSSRPRDHARRLRSAPRRPPGPRRPAPPEALDALLDALDGIERLVLLGDIVELAEGRPRQAMEVAEPVLRALGRRLGPARGRRRARQPRRRARAPVGAGERRGPGRRRRDPAGRHARARRRRLLAGAGTGARPLPGLSGSPIASGRRTATTSIATCCPRPPTGSPAACWAACRATAPRRPTTSARAAVGDAAGGAADPLAPAPARRADRRRWPS